jgi:hypothetical protein
MVIPRFALVRRATRTRDALVLSCWVASNAFVLIWFLSLPPDSSGVGAIFAWIVLLAFGLLWLVELGTPDLAGNPRFAGDRAGPFDDGYGAGQPVVRRGRPGHERLARAATAPAVSQDRLSSPSAPLGGQQHSRALVHRLRPSQ